MAATLTERLRNRLYRNSLHPYLIYEGEIARRLTRDTVVLDAGCGRAVEIANLAKRYAVRQAVGIDAGKFPSHPLEPDLIRGDIEQLPLDAATVDLVITRSVMEHVAQPQKVYAEFYRVLKPSGHCIILTPSAWDYASLGARIIPNRFHPRLVALMEGRDEADTFRTFYRANTSRVIRRLANEAGFRVYEERYLGQYPSYFMFNPALFILGTIYDKLVSRFETLRQLRGWVLVILQK